MFAIDLEGILTVQQYHGLPDRSRAPELRRLTPLAASVTGPCGASAATSPSPADLFSIGRRLPFRDPSRRRVVPSTKRC